MTDKKFIDNWLEARKDDVAALSDRIWEFAEMRFAERRSAGLLVSFLEGEGFAVEQGIGGIETAFVASWGSGVPVIAVLGEYDALAGLSQKCGTDRPEPLQSGAPGHGCGHNLLGAGAAAAAAAVRHLMEREGLRGTVRFYGCPGEEGGSGKAFMARAGVFDDVDAALTWHPFSHTGIMSVTTLANFQVAFRFHGRSAHAAAAPHLGRSALDAVELMNVGVNYLREHIIPEARVHYAVTNTGGHSPNVVQAVAEVLYLIRAPKLNEVREIYERVCKVAQGAALMSETECEVLFDKACSNYIPNTTLQNVMYENLREVGVPQWDAADLDFARRIRATFTENDLKSDLNMGRLFIAGGDPAALTSMANKPLSDAVLACGGVPALLPGSTDVGDVSWIVPTAQLAVTCQALGTPGHSWQQVSQSKSPLAHKGLQVAARVMARTCADLFAEPMPLARARQELGHALGGERYISPIPLEVQPKPVAG